MSIVLYGLECFSTAKDDIKSSDFVVTRFLIELFRTTNIDVIVECIVFLPRCMECRRGLAMRISTTKTEVMHQTAPGKPYHEPCFTVKGHKLQAVDRFTYLASTLSIEVNIDAEVKNRIAKASAAFGRLRKNVCECRGLSTTTLMKVYRAVVLTTLLHACETWAVYSRHAKLLNHFHTGCFHRLLRIK